ncbi:cytochrome c oxidase assembly protein [Rhabdothermincola sp.]|uniref:cytochrome c oxidase assembly protein n=1 Tax=Rhabdothermincola sp. TaxID=2820405 RepID=UPI002FE04F15
MSWWCSATREPWSWAFRAYPGIWVAMLTLIAGYAWSWHRHHRGGRPIAPGDRRKRWWFALGMAVLWLATDWPLGTLGAGYLATAHMVQYMLYTLVAAPLLLLGIPDWMVRPAVERFRLGPALRFLARPVVAGISYNLVLIATHAPFTVDTFRSSQLGSMLLDLTWLLSGLLLWTPLASPLRELRHPSPAVQCVYLFLAAGAIAMVPGGMLTFADFPLYRTYELAPRVYGLSASDDQQMAGILMKIGNIPIVWTVIFVIFVRWAMRDGGATRPAAMATSAGSRSG